MNLHLNKVSMNSLFDRNLKVINFPTYQSMVFFLNVNGLATDDGAK